MYKKVINIIYIYFKIKNKDINYNIKFSINKSKNKIKKVLKKEEKSIIIKTLNLYNLFTL